MSKKQRREIPRFAHPIIETHCHLDYLEADALADELQSARDVGVERIITIAVSPDNLDTVRAIAQREDRVFCTQGVHPHEAEAYSVEVGNRIRDFASSTKVVAIGEIGLDYYYDHADRAVQRRVFADQLAIAADCDLPVVIHSRDADDDMQSILAEHLESLPKRGVIHSFSSGLSLAEFALDANFMLGFNGMVTFNRADNVREAVAITPVKQLLLETDAPYLTPVPYRGRSNGPRYIPFVAEKVAEIKDLPIDDLLRQCYVNSERLFFSRSAEAIA
ncbi:TatD family hydrolase [Congregibacter sp.]|uniref:TatD family hydrolase n=1 Tax=Congregibacter sp. TaxID=2744308 RepID=UPI003F6A7C59